MKRLPIVATLMLLAGFSALAGGKEPFSGDSAYAALKTLISECGPRPMGSPAEQRAMALAVDGFRRYGCQEAFVMPMRSASRVNTTSGVAVGVLKGKTDRIIVIGAHIDTSDPEVPGANDDGSGVACVIELARVLGMRNLQSTIVFCCFGGEETGLRGSTFFVDHFDRIDSVALMVQIDMADGRGDLFLDPDGGGQVSSPRWLVEGALEAYRESGHSGLIYPTHGMALVSSQRDGALSDHGPFLGKGIPAIDFTSDTDYPLHGSFDNLETFTPSGLQRTGDIVLRLVEKFDGGVPSRDVDQYWLVLVGTMPFFFSHLALRVFAVLSMLFAVVALVVLWKRRPIIPKEQRVRWSGAKILLFTFLIQLCAWYSGDIVGVIRGLRFPWVNNVGGFTLLGMLFGLAGLWLVTRLAARLRLSADPFPFAVRSFALLSVGLAAFSFANAELGLYPASAVLCLSLAMLIRIRWLRVVLFLCSPWLMIRLMANDLSSLFERAIVMGLPGGFLNRVLPALGLVLLWTFLMLPFAYAYAALYRDMGGDLFLLRRVRSVRFLAGVGLAALACIVYLATRPVYDDWWPSTVYLEQRSTADSSQIRVWSPDALNGLLLQMDGKDTLLTGRGDEFRPPPGRYPPVAWASIVQKGEEVRPGPASESTLVFQRWVEVHTTRRPLDVRIRYTGHKSITVESPWCCNADGEPETQTGDKAILSWYSYPDTSLRVPVRLTVERGHDVTESVEVRFDSLASPMRWSRSHTSFVTRTIVTSTDTIRTDTTAAASPTNDARKMDP